MAPAMIDSDTPQKTTRKKATTDELSEVMQQKKSALTTLKNYFSGFFGMRKNQERSNFLVTFVLLLVVVVIANVIVSKRSIRIDTTTNKIYSLSPETTQVFQRLQDKKLKGTAFFERNRAVDATDDLLKELAIAYPKFDYAFVDPIENPSIVDSLGIDRNDLMQNPIVLEWEGKKQVVQPISEENIVNALVQMTSSKKPTVAFLGGHGTYSLGNNYSSLKSLLEKANYSPYEEILINKDTFTNGKPDVLIIPGSTSLAPSEQSVITKYLQENGRALFLVDPGDSSLFGEILAPFGVKLTNNRIFDRQGFSKDLQLVALEPSNQHLVTKNVSGSLLLFPTIQEILPTDPVPQDYLVSTIASSGGKSVFGAISFAIAPDKIPASGEITDTTEKKDGPVSAIVSVEKKSTDGKADPKGSRILVVGDKDFLVNSLVGNSQVRNIDLIKNALSWLAGNEDLIAITSKPKQNEPIQLTQQQHNYIVLLCLVIIPLMVVAFGIVIAIRRKQKQR